MRLQSPQGVAMDAAGNVYFSDKPLGRVYVRRTDGKVYAVAGTGVTDFSGDGGPAVAAQCHQIYGLALGLQGELYIADCGNRRIRVVDKAGIINTVIGTGSDVPLALDEIPKKGRLGTEVPLADPFVLLTDRSGNLWVTDCAGRRVYRYDPTTRLVQVIVSRENGGPAYPAGIALMGDHLVVADRIGRKLMLMDLGTGKIESWIGGVRDTPRFNFVMPVGVLYDGQRYLYVSDQFAGKIFRIDVAKKAVEVFAGGGKGRIAAGGKGKDLSLKAPGLMAWANDGTLLVSDPEAPSQHCILGFKPNGDAEVVVGCYWGEFDGSKLGDHGKAKDAALLSPRGLAANKAGDLYISDCNHRRIRKISRQTGKIETIVGRPGWLREDLPWPQRANLGGDPKAAFLISPRGLAFDAAENLYIVDVNHRAILKLDAASGHLQSVIKSDLFHAPMNIAVGLKGELYVDDRLGHAVWKIDAQGKLSVFAGTPGKAGYEGDVARAELALLNTPTGVAVGSGGEVYIGDTSNHRVRVVKDGVIRTFAGTGVAGQGSAAGAAATADLDIPRVLGLNAGELYIADHARRLLKISIETKDIELVAGGPKYGFAGDGGPATMTAQLTEPQAIAFYGNEIYVADSENHAIRKIWS